MKRIFTSTLLCLAFAAGLAEAQPLNNINSSLTIYVYPPYERINWSSPKTTINSMVNMQIAAELLNNGEVDFVSDFNEPGQMSSIYRSTMGHTIGHVQCLLPNGSLYSRWTSFTGQNYGKADMMKLVDKKLGAGVLFYDYVDGEVIAGDENPKRVAFYHGGRVNRQTNRPRYLQIEVGPQACAAVKDMVEFFESFHHPKMTLPELDQLPPEKRLFFSVQLDPYETYFARKADPQAKVGGGCAPYGAALMKIAGRYQSSLEGFFRRFLAVSERLIGGTVDPATGKIREVPIGDLMHGKLGDHWTYAGYNNRTVNIYDPQMIWDFVGNLMQCTETPGRCDTAVAAWLNSQTGFSKGQRDLRRVHYMAAVGPKIGPDGKPTERIPATREQAVDGMVWRLY